MRICEYRIVMPTSLQQYQVGNLYMTAQRSREETGGGEGVEVVKNEPFQNEKESGQYTYKIMHFRSKIPPFMRWAMPDKYCHCHEYSYNAYPHFSTEYKQPGMGDDMYMVVESRHFPYTKGGEIPENAMGLDKKELKKRKVVYLDILDSKPKPEKKEWDLHDFTCPLAGINEPLKGHPKHKVDEEKVPHWAQNYDGEMMIAIKLVKIKFHWRGLQTIVEKFALHPFYHNLFLDAHRALLRWSDKWYPMTLQQVHEFEEQCAREQNATAFFEDQSGSEEVPEGPPPGIEMPKEEEDAKSSNSD